MVDDNQALLNALKLLLKYEFEEVHTLRNPNLLPATLAQTRFDLIMLDMNFRAGVNSGNEGLFWLKEILHHQPKARVMLMTAYGDLDLAVRGMQQGAIDFVLKPWENDRLLARLHFLLQQNTGPEASRNAKADENVLAAIQPMLGNSSILKELHRTIAKVAKTDANVLITGENGTGKELVAQALHAQSLRAHQALVVVDVGAVAETLFESDLFGSLPGAFTDAREHRLGRLREANQGSLFLDEIGNLPLSLQAKLLTVLQRREVTPLGANKPEPIDIRLISATNKPLDEMVRAGLFRQDLLYRINTIQLVLPPLRERPEDIEPIARHYLQHYAQRYSRPEPSLSARALDKLRQHHWPGNVRELRHVIEKAVILCDNRQIEASDFQFSRLNTQATPSNSLNLNDVEKSTILKALQKHQGNLSNAAKELGITRTTLYNKIEKYKLQP